MGIYLDRTTLPSWVAPAPANVGSTRAGKLSADQWRSLCTVNLVITLVRLWGGKPRNDRHYWLLQNFMDLVTAAKLGTMRSMTQARIDGFVLHLHRYLENMLELFPHIGVTPNQHLSFHVALLLHRFGPSHAWRCWSFERWNHVLQNINTNMKFGKMLPFPHKIHLPMQ
ncbi:hypothetical protein BD410DRAFT_855780 [Rickenella mellea]|uniref:DUF4218 domain-containing protein n=1 Tax=Rickenella mellea TaxID=50990 RepID=A0A4Y7PIE7_9AGAM|nr:hypothetical protein BD410DRAFT_855780 [Rickenella mellea]